MIFCLFLQRPCLSAPECLSVADVVIQPLHVVNGWKWFKDETFYVYTPRYQVFVSILNFVVDKNSPGIFHHFISLILSRCIFQPRRWVSSHLSTQSFADFSFQLQGRISTPGMKWHPGLRFHPTLSWANRGECSRWYLPLLLTGECSYNRELTSNPGLICYTHAQRLFAPIYRKNEWPQTKINMVVSRKC